MPFEAPVDNVYTKSLIDISDDQIIAVEKYLAIDTVKKTMDEKLKQYPFAIIKITRKKYPSDSTDSKSALIRHLIIRTEEGELIERIDLPINVNDSGKNSCVLFLNKKAQANELIFHPSKDDKGLIARKKIGPEVQVATKDYTELRDRKSVV